MQTLSLVWGILAILGMIVGFFPCLGALNWINIPFSAVGLIISLVALAKARPDEQKTGAIAGTVCCAIAVVLGLIRLVLGVGIV